MHNGGFFEERKTSSTALGIIIAGHAALLIAIALNPTRFGPRVDWIPTVDTIRDKEPPPTKPLPPPRASHHAELEKPFDRIVDTLPQSGGSIPLQPLPFDPGSITPSKPADPVFVAASMDPAAAERFQPGYPSAKVREGVEGLATVKVLIGSDGRVRTVELVTATDPAFFDATKAQALRYWRFRPATRDGFAVESWRTMTVKFRLQS